jgi:Icc-related predicted phosphoesterase
MIRLLILSDLHLEHRPSWSLSDGLPDFDVAIFAGDIAGSPRDAVDVLSRQPALAERPIVYVPGNHEFHGGEIEARLSEGRAAAVGTRVKMLDRDTVVIDGARFIGAVLWTDYDFFPGIRDEAMIHAARSLEDHRAITIRKGARPLAFTPADALARHQADLAYIESELARPFAGPTVVVTHHAPHRNSVAFEHLDNMLTAAYVSDLSATIERGKPRLWAHGHTHGGFDYEVGGCRIVCNPEGYCSGDDGPERENPKFDERFVIEI